MGRLVRINKVVISFLFQYAKPFVDFKQLRVKGGNGGDGGMSFLSLPCNEWAGPDGGDGGNGAHVIFQGMSIV